MPQDSQGSQALSSVARFFTPNVPGNLAAWPHPTLCTTLCYRCVGSSGTQSTIASQTVKVAISLSPGDGTLVLKRSCACNNMQSHLILVLTWPMIIVATTLVRHPDGHTASPPYANATTHHLVYRVHSTFHPAIHGHCPSRVEYCRRSINPPGQCEPCQTDETPAAVRRNFSLCQSIPDRSVLPFNHSRQGLPLPTFTSQGLGSENKSTSAEKQFLASQLPKPRWVLLAATRPARPAADDSSIACLRSPATSPGTTSLPCTQFSARTGCPPAAIFLGVPGLLGSRPSSGSKDEVLISFLTANLQVSAGSGCDPIRHSPCCVLHVACCMSHAG
ncbi:hypothetical protein DHEL01_v205274 [Diaporthe helianthi]|uniref:Uncharacterized protein n=1 Tax=Diaporthe helianthi TaxID=158607 RepID=A0A2P5I1C4_DIAHE|nr:hypothetical protein DHEL01_v205274 [Diaporthe helianthi]